MHVAKDRAGITLIKGTNKATGDRGRRLRGKRCPDRGDTLALAAAGRRGMDLSTLKCGGVAHRKAKTSHGVGKAAPTTKRGKKMVLFKALKKNPKTHTNQKQTPKKKRSQNIGTDI